MSLHEEMSLISVNYLPEKRGIVVEFASPRNKYSKFYSYFPSFYLPLQSIQKEAVKELLQLYDSKRYKLNEFDSQIQVTASTFSDLKKIANLIFSSLKCFPLLVEPERQFLISKEWSYFDNFTISERECMKVSSKYADIRPEYLSDSLYQTLNQLQKVDALHYEEFSDNIVASNVLKVPIQKVPETIHQSTELFLENMYFSHGLSPSTHSTEFQKTPFYSAFQSANLPEKLFNQSLHSKLIFGPDTLNCSCCTPDSISAPNILPSSLVKVQFLSDGMYFESRLLTWANAFHHSHPLQQNRISRYREFKLNSIPIGPFQRNHSEFIPLEDAIQLESEKFVRILPEKQLQWFCSKKNSFLVHDLHQSNTQVQDIQVQMTSIQSSAYSQHQLMAVTLLAGNLPFQLYSKHCQFLKAISKGVFQQFLNTSSKFYSEPFANALVAMAFH